MRKLIVASLVLGLLPIMSAPADAGVRTCKSRQIKEYTTHGPKYVYKFECRYSRKGRSN
jgi:hypothetical protein